MCFKYLLPAALVQHDLQIVSKLAQGKGWIGTLVLGILGVLLGMYSLAHPVLLAFTFGVLVGVYFIESGINMIVIAVSVPSAE